MELPRRDLTDPRALRALAHPTRQHILRRLAQEGPATSAMLARELNEDRGATSFHLRQLGAYGFIVVDEERSEGRRKFWRLVAQDLRLPRVPGEAGAEEAAATMTQLWGESLAALARFYQDGDPWVEDAELSHSVSPHAGRAARLRERVHRAAEPLRAPSRGRSRRRPPGHRPLRGLPLRMR